MNSLRLSVSHGVFRILGVLGESLALLCVPSICHVTIAAEHAINLFSRLGAGTKERLITIPRVQTSRKLFFHFSFFLEGAVYSRQ